jgi:hypothetical protein
MRVPFDGPAGASPFHRKNVRRLRSFLLTGVGARVMNRHGKRSQMMIFTIDINSDIRAHESEAQAEETAKLVAGTMVVRSEKELVKAAAEWPATRLVELWNSFAGVAPFTDCKPVKKFENHDKAVARIWAAIQRLGNAIEPKPAEPAPAEDAKPVAEKAAGEPKPAAAKKASQAKTKAAPKTKGKKAAAGKPREGTHKAEVIAMMQRKGGATLEEIVKATGWQKHTVRGFISIVGSKGGMKIASSRRESDGARVYEA